MTVLAPKVKVLVFPCGSEVGLEIYRSLAKDIHVELLGASSESSNHGKYLYRDYTEGLPYITDHTFLDVMNTLIRKRQIDSVFPTMDNVALKLATHEKYLACKFIGSPLETYQICCSKRLTYEMFSKIIRVPKLYPNLDDVTRWPIFLKPDCGYGSRGTRLVGSREEAQFHLSREQGLLAMDMDVSILVNDFQIEIDRAFASKFRTDLSYRHVYIDLDNCLICNEVVNTEAVAFLYQCVNRGIGIHLLTHHAACVDQTLKQARLNGLFDSISRLQSGERNTEAFHHTDAIFIDDSFAERRDVQERKGIPVFAPDAIECLLD